MSAPAATVPAGPEQATPVSRTPRPSIVCLSPQRWHADLPTNRQQIMLRAAARGHRVLFVETGNFLGRHVWSVVRGLDRRATALQLASGERVADDILAVKALNVAPRGHTYRFAAALNNRLTAIRLRRLVRSLPEPVVAWLYDPCALPVAERLGAAAIVYDCVDDYAEQAGPDARTKAHVREADLAAGRRADLVFATATPLVERHRQANPQTHLVRNVADYAHFAPAADRALATVEIREVPRPVLGFVGNLMATKVDFALLDVLARARPEWSIVLAGPVRPDAAASAEQLSRLPNIHLTGPARYPDVPRIVAGFDVGLIPYAANAYTRSCFPLKTYEYLAAGKPVVASGLPELAGMEPDVRLVADGEAAVAAVERALEELGPEHRNRRMGIAAANTWEARAERLLGLVEAELARG